MKTTFVNTLALAFGLISMTANAQETARKGWDGTVKGGTIHIETDANGYDMVYLPTSPKPTVLVS